MPEQIQSPMSFNSRIKTALANPKLRLALDGNYTRWRERRTASFAALPHADDVRDHARAIRVEALTHLDHYLLQLESNVKAHGGTVHWAKDAEEANRLIAGIISSKNPSGFGNPKGLLVAKSKSMLSEEIHLNAHLEKLGLKIVETDLGEWIVQLRGETPSHLTAPAIHLRREDVAELFEKHLGLPRTDDVPTLINAAREALRPTFLNADVGISGVNFGVAETGTLCLITNEGNGRLVTTIPKIHIALMGIERVVPTMRDLEIMIRVLARSGTGQKITTYTNLITGARRPDDPDGPEELHLVLIDNGRSRVLASDLAESLLCIRCGACVSVCPVYRQIGGHAYNATYMGPIGSILMPALNGVNEFGELAHASTLCGECRDVCPVRIDIPKMLLRVRHAHVEQTGGTRWIAWAMKIWSQVTRSPRLYHFVLKISSALAQPLARGGWIQKLPPPLNGWTHWRDFPLVARETFSERLAKRKS
ncbi:MAG: iron-sulfur cluster-binding protein [Chloroflexi bacterium]|nr:iron-sulfur cluster-binding protein [Chloroflexota bacterium]